MEPIIETGEKGVYDGIIVFTDGEFGQIERNAPRMPVLWVVANRDVDHKIPVNWGEIVHMPILEKSYE
jgi:predicted metal-dependent peptidase